jgi:hypothetical protein
LEFAWRYFVLDLFNEISELFRIDCPKGYSHEAVETAKKQMGGMPELLEQFYLRLGCSDELNHLQDFLILPDKYPIFSDWDYLVFFNENQGVCQAGIHKKSLSAPNPPVYVSDDDGNWIKSSDCLAGFLIAMFGYQASICLEHGPNEFYWVTEEEKKQIATLFPKRQESLKTWLGHEISLYGNNKHARIALMEASGYIQLNYAANNISDFENMRSILQNIGEVI